MGINRVVCVHVEGSSFLNDGWDKARCARGQAFDSQNGDGCEVQGCGREGGGSL